VKAAEITAVEVSVGVQLHRATIEVVATAPHPEIVEAAFIKLNVPSTVEVAVSETVDPYETVVVPLGIERAITGLAFVTVKVTVTGVDPVEPVASVTVIVCVYVPTGRFFGAFN
jgi:hypothetical protein